MDPEINWKQFFLNQTLGLYNALMYNKEYHKTQERFLLFVGKNRLSLFCDEIKKRKSKQNHEH